MNIEKRSKRFYAYMTTFTAMGKIWRTSQAELLVITEYANLFEFHPSDIDLYLTDAMNCYIKFNYNNLY